MMNDKAGMIERVPSGWRAVYGEIVRIFDTMTGAAQWLEECRHGKDKPEEQKT